VVALAEQIAAWRVLPQFVSASVHRSRDGVRAFTYSQWRPCFDPRDLPQPAALAEFFPADRHLLEVFASRSRGGQSINIVVGDTTTHLAEFRMRPTQQPRFMELSSEEVTRSLDAAPGLLSATFHRSLDGTRAFNYGQWESEAAFQVILKQSGFNPDQLPYWEGFARNEFHLYDVVRVQSGSA
jgi:quinol monooxygenase YgiN